MLFVKLKLANCARLDHPRALCFLPRTNAAARLLLLVITLVPGKRPLRGSVESKRKSIRMGKPACNLLYLTSPAKRTAPMQGVMISWPERTNQIIRDIENEELYSMATNIMAYLRRPAIMTAVICCKL
jgi:hypothetical protein